MAKFSLTDAQVKINSVDLSQWAFNVDLHLEKEQLETSGFNAAGAKSFIPGAKDEEFVVSFRQDFASSAVDQTLWPLYSGGTAFPFSLQPTSGSTTTTNPLYSGTANLFEYHPLDGEFGAVAETQVTFKVTGGVSRSTA